MVAKNFIKNRDNELIVQEVNGEVLIYDLIVNKAYVLNETATMVWNLCDGNNSVADISRKLGVKLKQPVTDDLVWLALEKFKKDDLLTESQNLQVDFGGLSRREVIRKVGFASLVALPAVAVLVAPTAAMAASTCIAYGLSCTVGGAAVCCPQSLCAATVGGTVCTCRCNSPGDCLAQTGCPNTGNCNPSKVCAP